MAEGLHFAVPFSFCENYLKKSVYPLTLSKLKVLYYTTDKRRSYGVSETGTTALNI